MRVHIVDPSAYTPPYDHALCSALAAAGADVELYTSRFAYGPVRRADGYARRELFYRAAAHVGDRAAPARAVKLAEHVPDMLRYRRARTGRRRRALPVADRAARRRPSAARRAHHRGARRPLVLTAHDILPREARPGQREAQRRLYEHFDAIVVHSEHGRDAPDGELGVDGERVHVIPHGAFEHLAADGCGGAASPPPFQTDGRWSCASG